MTYQILRLLHIIGAILIGAGLIGVWLSDLRSRQVRDLSRFGEAVRNVRVFYDGLVVPGALVLLASGIWLIVTVYGGWSYHFLRIPWLAGMVILFALEFIEGNTITRVYFLRLRRLTVEAEATGRVSPALKRARAETLPTFTHFLDLPIFLVIVALGVTRPNTWSLFFAGTGVAVVIAVALTIILPRLYPDLPDGIVVSGAAQPSLEPDGRFAPIEGRCFDPPSAVERVFNKLFGFLVGLGLGLPHNYLVQVRGRRSGRLYSTPVNVLDRNGARFLVAGRGQTQWVRNAVASGTVSLKRGRWCEEFRIQAVPDDEKPEILKAYLDRFKLTVQRYFPVPAGSPAEFFRPFATSYPVLELMPKR